MYKRTYPDAAWRPSPREPPVTTATLPLREKKEEKSLSLTSASADMIAAGQEGCMDRNLYRDSLRMLKEGKIRQNLG